MAERSTQYLIGTRLVFHSALLLNFIRQGLVPELPARPTVVCRLVFTTAATLRSYRFPGLIDDIVYDSVFLGLLRIHNEVALHIFLHFIQLLARVLG